MHRAENPESHPLFQPELTPCGGLSLFQPDWMHTKSLGTDSTLAGSCLLFLAKEVLPGESVDANLAFVWEKIQAFYKENRTQCRLSRLTKNMVDNVPFPKLSAKAIEIRDLLPALEHFLRAWLAHPQVAWFHRLVAISCRLDTLVFSNPSCWLTMQEREAGGSVRVQPNAFKVGSAFPRAWTCLLQLYN